MPYGLETFWIWRTYLKANMYIRPKYPVTGPPHDPGDQLLVLIETLLSQNGLLGRRQLLEEAKASGICMTEYRLRKTLKVLEEDGKIIMGKGKVGIRLK